MPKKIILHILQSNKLSGAENVAADISIMLKDQYEFIYCSPNGTIRNALEIRNISFHPLEKFNLRQIKKAINTIKPDIIHAHDIQASVYSAVASKSIPIVSHVHVNKNDMHKITIKSLLYAIASFKFKKIIFVSKDSLLDFIFKHLINEKSIILRNIISSKRLVLLSEKSTDRNCFSFIYLGRLENQKDPIRIAHVASAVLKKLPNTNFGIVGDGSLKNEMEDIFRKYKVSDRVTFTGVSLSPYEMLKNSKCLLMCSKYEGTPIAALEAQALGLPIVSTPVDGMKEIIKNGENGYLSDVNEDLSNFVCEIITNNDLHKRLSASSLNNFNKLNIENTYLEKIKEIYNY